MFLRQCHLAGFAPRFIGCRPFSAEVHAGKRLLVAIRKMRPALSAQPHYRSQASVLGKVQSQVMMLLTGARFSFV